MACNTGMSLSSTLGILPRPRAAAEPVLAGPPRRSRAARAARLAAALAGLVAIGAYLFVALRRLDYPFALEQLEGNSLVEVHRILTGQPLYPAPTASYVPDGYPPLYFLVQPNGANGDVVHVGGVASPGAEFLREKRTWQGLGSDFETAYQEDAQGRAGARVEQGRSGIARGYTVGEGDDKT